MNIEDMTIKQFKDLAAMFGSNDNPSPYVPGSVWLFRCVTHYTVGTVDKMVGSSIVLCPGACWVADTGRYHEFLRDGWSVAREVEPFPDGVVSVVERGALVDAQEWKHGECLEVIG